MKRAYLPVITALLLVACSEDLVTSDNAGKELTFSVGNSSLTPVSSITRSTLIESDYEKPLYMVVTSESAGQALTTRGTEVTSISTIYASAYSGSTVQTWCDGISATYNTDGLFHTNVYWYDKAGDYDFYVWYPAASSSPSNGLTVSGKNITYNISGLASSAMPDLLGGKATTNYATKHGKVDLTLNHLLTPVCFKLAANYGGGTIKSIKFSSLVTSATCEIGTTIGTTTWTPSTPGEYTTQALSTTGSTTEEQVDGSQYFMMIPQTISAGTIITITTQKVAGEVNTLTYTVPAGGFTWTAGQVVTYTISTSAVNTLTATYPSWTDGSSTSYGPVDAYTTSETFGLFAVDASGKVVLSNVEIIPTSVSGQTATFDLANGTNASSLSNYILSNQYTYYLMYPYNSSASDVPVVGSTGHANQTADAFFNSVISGWSPANDQDNVSKYKAQDLQVAKIDPNTTNAAMAHKMGLDCITLGTHDIVETRYFKAEDGTFVEDDRNMKTITASANFGDKNPYLYDSDSKYYFIQSPTSVTFNSTGTADKDKWENALTPNPAAGHIANATAYPLKSSTRTKDGRTGDYYYKGWVYTYNGTLDPHTNGSVQSFTAEQAGSYKLEVWGAQGGDGRYWNDSPHTKVVGAGGKGGYTYGDYNIPNGSYSLYVCVGGQGEWANYQRNETTNPPLGGYNGGGNGGTETEQVPENAAGGGGATHIATTHLGTLDSYSSSTNQSSVLIVAGGGGGAAGDFSKGWNVITSAYGIPDNPTKKDIADKLDATIPTDHIRPGTSTRYGFFDDDRFEDYMLITNYFTKDGEYADYHWGTLPATDKEIISKTVYKWYGGAGGGGVDGAGQTTYKYSYGGPATLGETYTYSGTTYPLFGKGRDGYNVGSGNIGGTGGGGGGWYGGYHKDEHINDVSAGGAGGSSHVNTSSVSNYGGESGVKSGDGEARIRTNFEWY